MSYMKSGMRLTDFDSLIHHGGRYSFWSVHETHGSLREARERLHLAFNFTFLHVTAIWI